MAPLNEHKTRKKGIFGIFGHSLFLFFQKKQMRYPSSLSSSIQKSPWNLFIVIPIPSWNGFQLFPKAVGKSFVSSNKKKSAIFVQLLLKSPQICEFLTACSANLKKCVSTVITKWVGKNGRFTTAYTVLLRILKMSLTLIAVWGNDLHIIFALDNELGGLFCLIIPIPFSNWQGWVCAFLCVVRVKRLDV